MNASTRSRLTRGIAAAATAFACLAVAPAAGQAATALSVAPGFPSTVTAGQTVPAAELTITNVSTANEAVFPIQLSNITLVPSCGAVAIINCPVASFDPDVFSLGTTATGDGATGCAAQVFTVTKIDFAQDKYAFTPTFPVVLGPAGTGPTSTCTIRFAVTVLKVPVLDARADPGVQTQQLGGAEGEAPNDIVGGGAGSGFTTVNRATPTISTQADPATTLGGTIADGATVSDRVNPQPGATITFALYGPNDATCSNAPAFSSAAIPYPVGGGPVASPGFTPTAAGTYRWRASYSGDANNNPVSGACNDPNENVVVLPGSPTIATSASPNITLGAGTISDGATVSGRVSALAGATITFSLYGPDDTTCTGAPVFSPAPVSYPTGGGPVTSPAFTPTAAGIYRWIASYSGDANNNPVTGACNDPNENVVVAANTPGLSTTASGDITLGAGQLTDTAVVNGLINPLASATITFNLYGPGDTTCTGPPVFSPAAMTYPVAGGPVTSPAFTPTAAGTYRWRATYSGDANNAPSSGACNDPNENVVVAPASPTIATTASAAITLGAGQLTDTATVSGRVNPLAGASITFTLYGPDDATCAGPSIFTSTVAQPVADGPVTSDPFTPTAVGTYRWIATYAGDANNNAVTGACNAPNESTVVSPSLAQPTIATTASPGITLGAGQLTDAATVSGRVDPVAGATVTFTLYGPDDATCTGTPAFTASESHPVADGVVTSPAFTPTTAGTYRWIAVYSGDAKNLPVSGACNDANESTVVAKAQPVITQPAQPSVTVSPVRTRATVTGLVNPQPGATVTFKLYRSSDTTCSGTPVLTSVRPAPANGGTVTSDPIAPAVAGYYRWTATYSGDVNNNGAQAPCGPLFLVLVNDTGNGHEGDGPLVFVPTPTPTIPAIPFTIGDDGEGDEESPFSYTPPTSFTPFMSPPATIAFASPSAVSKTVSVSRKATAAKAKKAAAARKRAATARRAAAKKRAAATKKARARAKASAHKKR